MKSLLDLEPRILSKPDSVDGLAARCWKAASRPLNQLGAEDLRLLVSQKIGLDIVFPIALSLLENNLLESGDLYTGDLLATVSRVDEAVWKSNPELHTRYQELMHDVSELSDTLLNQVLPNWPQIND